MRRVLAPRKTSHAFGRGRLTFLRPGNRKILAYLRELGDEAILCVANVGRSAQPVELDLARFRVAGRPRAPGPPPFPANRGSAVHADSARSRLLLVPSRDRRPGTELA